MDQHPDVGDGKLEIMEPDYIEPFREPEGEAVRIETHIVGDIYGMLGPLGDGAHRLIVGMPHQHEARKWIGAHRESRGAPFFEPAHGLSIA